MKIFIPFLLATLPCLGFAITWENQCAGNGFSLIDESDHFEVCKKPKTDDGITNTVSIPAADAQGVLQSLEKVFSFYTDSLGWMLPFPKSPDKKLKSNIYVFENAVMASLYGGLDYVKDLNGEYGPGMWIGVGSLKDYWGTSHEFAHGLQGVAGWMGNNSHAGWFAESHANWMAHQYNPKDAHCSEYLINFPYLYYGSTRDRYCNWQFLEHLKEKFGGGNDGAKEVNRLWMESIHDGEDGRMEQTPFTAMMMVYSWTLEDLNREFGQFAMKNATFEYAPEKKKLYSKSWGDYEFSTRRNTSNTARHMRVTMLNRMDSASGGPDRYIVPNYWAPQRWGYNIVRIYPDSAGKVTVKFRGIVQHKKGEGYKCFGDNEDTYKGKHYKWCNYAPDALPDPASQWAVGLVAEGSDGTPRYSELMLDTAGNISIETKASDKALWLAVTAAPSEMQTILWDQFYYSVYRYPYMIEVVNGKPEGYNDNFWKPAGYAGGSAQGYAKHANGGGWVSSKAKVDASVYIGPDAVVNGGTVTGDARIEDFAVVNGGTVGGMAVVRGRALVSGGSMADNAILEEDAWLVSGTIKDDARVGALSVITNSTVSGKAQVHGVMWPVDGKKLSGTAQLRGDLENNFTSEISKGIFYGMVNTDMLNNANFGANLTEPPADATADFADSRWYALAEDSLADVPLHMVSWRAPALASAKGRVEIDVFDLNGKWLGSFPVLGISNPNEWLILLRKANFPAGMYVVRERRGHRSSVIKLDEI
ncbi:DUF6055 domain-containing protein [uncultured Fibrobacter sp.]|uniref:DUF6055 domain-containing protein n=1 Tax=uncultured Fibrobacter sp. TaxID=261512 RepID=UPI0025DD38D5|nr:DUF6055 domain-containing protein [uncultured Fibrobacter sp.]